MDLRFPIARAKRAKIARIVTKIRTLYALGLVNVIRVAKYRLGLKSGFHPVQGLTAPIPVPPFFHSSERQEDALPMPVRYNMLWWFDWYSELPSNGAPDWFYNPFCTSARPDTSLEWWRIPDFDAGDIKGLWELSRMDWVVAWATSAASGDETALKRLNLWLADWAQHNPPYKGSNWKCGQEASIRVMHLVTAAWALGQDRAPEPGLVALLRAHLQRIAPTISYAIAQQNNHGTSEAAALFIGGSFLSGHDPRAAAWEREGRKWLEERAANLIEPDGSFSQYSVNYHRLMLDTFSLAEAWRRHLDLSPFSPALNTRLAAATEWLWSLTDTTTGDAPNIGANDGARLIPLTGCDYRDFRPSVQLATALFRCADAFGQGPWMAQLHWLRVPEQKIRITPRSRTFDDGGYHVLRTDQAMAVLRYPRFKFRPSQADALHVDLWHLGTNLLRDAGTFSYNTEGADWFSGTKAHNTVEFDGRDQMPRLGRFLFGDWLTANAVIPVKEILGSVTAAAGYISSQGVQHKRSITLTNEGLTCTDTVSGSFKSGCIRWRLAPGDWQLEDTILRSEHCIISIEIDGTPVMPTLGITEESRYYLLKTIIPVASVNVDHAATLVTKVTF